MPASENQLISSLSSKLGGVKQARDQLIFRTCPSCSNNNWNFEVSVSKGVGHCWICDFGCTVYRIFKMLGLPFEDDGLQVSDNQPVNKLDDVSLDTFKPVAWVQHKKFLESRGLDKDDIHRYQIMTTDKGKFRDKIIFPLYEGNRLVYIVARDSAPKGRYYNINVNRSGLLPYYLGKVDKTTVYLCEGIMDAISVNKLGYSSAVLLGTVMTMEQLHKIDSFGFKKMVISLDGDALEKSMKIYDMVVRRRMPVLVTLFDKKDDPNSVFVRDKAELKFALNGSREISVKDRVFLKLTR
jgi:DNA primase